MTVKHHFVLLGFICLVFLNTIAYAEETDASNTSSDITPHESLPNPLSLTQAFDYAKKHPWLKIQKKTLGINHPSQFFHPFYLNCHKLAYSNDSIHDYQRGRRFSPLFSPENSLALDILQRFFDVLLADQHAAYNNESMASGFITLDRIRNRQELNAASELNVAEKDTLYQDLRQQRFASERIQRLTRSLLAQALYSAKLPADLKLAKPLPKIPEELPSTNEIYQTIKKIKQPTEQTKKPEEADKKNKTIHTPEQALLDMELRQFILERLLLIQQLTIAQETAKSHTYWRDLKLDQSRTLYDFEVKSDLGNSMALQTQALLREKQIHYCQILAWAELNALQNKPLLTDPNNNEKPTEHTTHKENTGDNP